MPGVLVIEALAQTACIAGMMIDENRDKIPLFTGIEDMKFRRQVIPGDTLMLETEFIVFRRGMGKAKVRASVQGQTAAEGVIKFAMMDSNGKEKP